MKRCYDLTRQITGDELSLLIGIDINEKDGAMYVIAARYFTREGEEGKVAEFLTKMASISNSDAEPGCVQYAINQSIENPRSFLLYEQYRDEAGFTAHTQTDHFKELVLEGAVPLLEHREREIYNLIAP